MENITLGTMIRNARIAKKYSEKYLADMCGICYATLSHIEIDKVNPHLRTLRLLCNALDIDFNEAIKKAGYLEKVDTDISLSIIIKNARISKGYTQEHLASLCTMSCQQLWNIERGKTLYPTKAILKLLCDALDLDFQEISKLSKKSSNL